MNKLFLQAGSLLGAVGVMIGAFGAHALKPMLVASGRFETFETGVRYQFYHAIALVFVGNGIADGLVLPVSGRERHRRAHPADTKVRIAPVGAPDIG